MRTSQRILQANSTKPDAIELEHQLIPFEIPGASAKQDKVSDEAHKAHEANIEKAKVLPFVGAGTVVKITPAELAAIDKLPADEAVRVRRELAAKRGVKSERKVEKVEPPEGSMWD